MIFSPESEQAVLGCILLDNSIIKEINLQPKQFGSQKNGWIFEAMKELDSKGEPIDISSLAFKFDSEKLESIGNVAYIAELANSVPYADNFKHYEKLVLEAWKLRRAEQVASRLKEEIASTKSTDVITTAIKYLTQLDEYGDDDEFNMRETMVSVMENLEAGREGDIQGIDTGFFDLNELTYGWKSGELIIIGARPSMGKTAFALSSGIKAAKKGVVVTIFSLEMDKESLMARLITQEGMIDASKMQNPKRLEDGDFTIVSNTMGAISDLSIFIYDKPGLTIQEIRSRVRKLHRQFPNRKHLIIIDYLQLIKVPGKESRNQEIGELSRELKMLARELKHPVIALSQLSRSLESRKDKRPIMSDIRESGNIEQDADKILFLYRDDYYDPESKKKNVVEISVAKHRNGPTGKAELIFLKQFNLFKDLALGR